MKEMFIEFIQEQLPKFRKIKRNFNYITMNSFNNLYIM